MAALLYLATILFGVILISIHIISLRFRTLRHLLLQPLHMRTLDSTRCLPASNALRACAIHGARYQDPGLHAFRLNPETSSAHSPILSTG